MLGQPGVVKEARKAIRINGGPGTQIVYVFFTEKIKFQLFDISNRKPLDSTDSDKESSDSSGSSAGKYERFSNHDGL